MNIAVARIGSTKISLITLSDNNEGQKAPQACLFSKNAENS